jgi:hypothetical protein
MGVCRGRRCVWKELIPTRFAPARKTDLPLFKGGVNGAQDTRHHVNFWKIKNAPAAISAKPSAWFQASGCLR